MILLLASCASPTLHTLNDPTTWWARNGWVQVHSPSRLPSAVANNAAVEVWAFLPNGETLTTEELPSGEIGLVFPPGSQADRVEWRGQGANRRVVDVRGTRLGERGERWHHVYLPTLGRPNEPLVGVEWRAGDTEAKEASLNLLVEAIRPYRGSPDDWERSYRSKHGCDDCHVAKRHPNRRSHQHGLVNRGTDGQGWFTPSTVLHNSVPGETYGQWHGDRRDPYMRPSCDEARGQSLCNDGSVPTWHLDVASALTAAAPHARDHCDSLSWTVAHLSPSDPTRLRFTEHPCIATTPTGSHP